MTGASVPRRSLRPECVMWVQMWQGPALDALAAWLGEDPGRLEPRLRQQDAVQRFVALFASYSQNADSEALARLLDPFLRIMKRSRKITVRPTCTISYGYTCRPQCCMLKSTELVLI